MDIVPYVAALQTYVQTHPLADSVASFIAGGLAANPSLCANMAFKMIDKIPPLRWVITSNWPKISRFIDRFQDQFGKDVEASNKEAVTGAPPAPDTIPAKGPAQP